MLRIYNLQSNSITTPAKIRKQQQPEWQYVDFKQTNPDTLGRKRFKNPMNGQRSGEGVNIRQKRNDTAVLILLIIYPKC